MSHSSDNNRSAKELIMAAASGALFGAGLVISGMSDPNKVLSFLTLGPGWDPSLLIVMAVATLTAFAGYRLVWRRRSPWLQEKFHVPTNRRIDSRLLAGATCFGLGWGLVGYCPGPALTALVINPREGLWFVSAMVLGMLAKRLVERPEKPAPTD